MSTVLLGIGGGVAAYKGVALASELRRRGCTVHVAMTAAATRFVGPLSFAAVTGNPVLTELLPAVPGAGKAAFPHLFPATEADVCVVAPATADLIAKLAVGLAGDVVTAGALSLPARCQRIVCPTMNVEMWAQPSVQANVATLEERGWQRLGPAVGSQACGAEGAGRMVEPDAIADAVSGAISAAGQLAGRRVLVLSGPTREPLDDVRFISNHSSGRMGRELALAAARAGATVDFVTGPVADLPTHPRISITPVTTAADMLAAAAAAFPQADAAVFAAAVADYRPANRADGKPAKTAGAVSLDLAVNPDIAATLGAGKRPGQLTVGFALEADDGERKAREKLDRKQLDAIVLNAPAAMGADVAAFSWITSGAAAADWGSLSKSCCAERVVGELASRLADGCGGR
jgi:phosphopantothenoylcysteine decarboxylase/phosphopantothenate--cysteine ligase